MAFMKKITAFAIAGLISTCLIGCQAAEVKETESSKTEVVESTETKEIISTTEVETDTQTEETSEETTEVASEVFEEEYFEENYDDTYEEYYEPEYEEVYIEDTSHQDAGNDANYYEMDVLDLGMALYGIPEWNITRALKLISIEGYYMDYTLDYYCACTVVNRLIGDPYCGDIYSYWGGGDGWYGTWLDCYGIADHAYSALRDALLDPADVWYCNGVDIPSSYVYAAWDGSYWIYVY